MSALATYRTLGPSGLRVSPLCLGTMTFGQEWGWGADAASSEAMLDRYLGAGGNFDRHRQHLHEGALGGDPRGLFPGPRRTGQGRDRHQVLRQPLFPGDPNGGGAGRKAVHQQLEQSLRRLRTDYVDLYWMHFQDPHTPVEETLRALDDLVGAGKVRYIGFSDTPAWRVAEAQVLARFRGWSPLVALQIEYSLLERTVEGDLLPCARAFGLGVTPWSPLKGGLLTGKYARDRHPEGEGRHAPGSRHLTERTFGVLEALEAVARELGLPVASVALAWVLARPGVVSPILGARTLAQLEGNLAALEAVLPPEAVARLDAASAPVEVFPHGFLPNTLNVMQGGATVNGQPSAFWPLAPKSDAERW